jgi:C1A family cysteine protease
MIYQVVAFSMLAATAVADLSTASPASLQLMFESFKREHRVTYANVAEESSRFAIFRDNLKLIDMRNARERKAGGSAQHGITRFSDLTPEEFTARYLTYTKDDSRNATVADIAPVAPAGLVDWTGTYTTPVKDQGYCGSCWAFAASEQIESDAMRTLGVTFTLSPQQLVECDRSSLGCNGGLQERAYKYVQRAGGFEQEVDYPYISGTDGSADACHADSSKFVLTVKDYSTIKGESSMASYVQSTGPVSIAIDASTWSSYTGGIMSVCGHDINHAVQAVGVDASSNGYWKVRNSWGPNWGENGFIRLAYGQDTCGVTYDVTYTSVAQV